jgi:nucleotide-binding universal stress UspA family protein
MLPIHSILYATDFSERSAYAFRLACSLARDYGARLCVLHIAVPPVVLYGEGMVAPEPEWYQEELIEKLHRLQPPDPKVVVEHRLLEGEPAEQIIRTARETQSDLIIMGTHGRTGLGRLLMGSVAEHVMRKAPCPVLTVKTPFHEAEPLHEYRPRVETTCHASSR